MTYNPNIPQPTDTLSASQPQLLVNFQQCNSIFGTDHVDFVNVTVADRGKHNKVSFVNQGADPVSGAAEGILFQKDVGGTPCVFWTKAGNPAFSLIGKSTPTLGVNVGHTILPGGLLLQWGSVFVPSGESGNIPFSTAFGSVLSLTATFIRAPTSSTTSVYVSNTTATTFRVVSTASAAHVIYWMAIGTEP